MKHKIELINWDYTCSDRCCYDSGITLMVDGEELTLYADNNIEETIKTLLEKLGIDAEITTSTNYED